MYDQQVSSHPAHDDEREPRETELKLEVPVRSLSRLNRSPLLKKAAAATRKPASLTSVYYDTDKLKLRRRGLFLRVRRGAGRCVQTIKQADTADAAMLTRGEWEHEIRTRGPDFKAARDSALAPLLDKKLKRGLKPVFQTRVRRKAFQLKRGDSIVELSIDQGSIEAGRKRTPLCEVELELKRGRATDLFALARSLSDEVPVQLAVKSKADRGYALITAAKPEAVKAGKIALAPDADVQSAFQTIARACLHQLVANRPALLDGDPEGVHQMRVALRRLRAAISLFSDMLTDPQTIELKAELKWITGAFGPARELEVFSKRAKAHGADGGGPEHGWPDLDRDLRHRSEAANARARAAVESPRFRALVLDTAAWIEAGDWTRLPDEPACRLREQAIAEAAAGELRRRWRKMRKGGKRLADLDPERRHKLRIQGKKLRYAAEFFAGAFPGKKPTRRREKFVKRLEKLQDALGELNDISVNEKLSERVANGGDAGDGTRRTRKAFAAGRVSGREEARVTSALKAAEQTFAAFVAAKAFWMHS